jgi:hypothetical protein|tara:strand:- start:340 stop:573 length:234 start_codon:yes stop_codon:yes gene_type:complete
MNKYRVGLYEETGGYIEVEAENQEKAEEIAEELVNNYGCDKLFYPEWNADGCEEDLTKYHGNHKHGDREVVNCEEIK